MSGNKLFWEPLKPFFSDKGINRDHLKLAEGDKFLQDDSQVEEETV